MPNLISLRTVENAELFKASTPDKKGKDVLYIKLKNGRFSYPHIDKPYKGKNDKGEEQSKYGVKFMMPYGTHKAACDLVAETIEKILKINGDAILASDRKFMRDGKDLGEKLYLGHWIVSANESKQPKARNVDNEVITDNSVKADLFQGGHWGDIFVRPWFQDGQTFGKGYGKRMNCGLVGIRFTKKDETFGEGQIDDSDAWDKPDTESNDAMAQEEF